MMNAATSIAPGERGVIGVGFGTFAGQQSIAIGSTCRFGDKDKTTGAKVLFNSSAGFGLNRNTFGAGAGFSVRF